MKAVTETKKVSTSVLKCSCTHEYQDQKYGKGMRVKNGTQKGTHRCTVCGATS